MIFKVCPEFRTNPCGPTITVAVFVMFKQGLSITLSDGDILPIITLGIINTGVGCHFYFSSIGKIARPVSGDLWISGTALSVDFFSSASW